MTWKRKITGAALAGVMAVGAAVAFAQGFGPGRHMRGHRLEMLASRLNLTEAQKVAARTLMEQTRQEAQPYVTQLKQGHETMAAAVKANKSAAEITQIASAQGALIGQVIATHAKAMAQFYIQLTPEQKAKADEMHAHFKEIMQRSFDHNRN